MEDFTIFSFLFSIFITITSYFLIPAILIIIGKKYSLSSIRIIAFANALLLYCIFAFSHYMSGSGTPNFTACCIWGSAAYYLLKRKLVIESKAIENVSKNNIESPSDIIQSASNGSIKPHKFSSFILPIVLFVFVGLAAVTGYYVGIQHNSPTIFSNAYNNGLASGYENGYEKGYSEGYTQGELDGKSHISSTYGYRTGYDEGYRAGTRESYYQKYPVQ